MEKLRLDLNGLKVESFAPDGAKRGKGTVRGYDDSTCSQGYTCGMMSRGPETYELEEQTLYACTTCV
jgi:hypothetical protein